MKNKIPIPGCVKMGFAISRMYTSVEYYGLADYITDFLVYSKYQRLIDPTNLIGL